MKLLIFPCYHIFTRSILMGLSGNLFHFHKWSFISFCKYIYIMKILQFDIKNIGLIKVTLSVNPSASFYLTKIQQKT